MTAETEPRSAIELLERAKGWLAPMIQHLPVGVNLGAERATELIDEALELLRDDGK